MQKRQTGDPVSHAWAVPRRLGTVGNGISMSALSPENSEAPRDLSWVMVVELQLDSSVLLLGSVSVLGEGKCCCSGFAACQQVL